MKRQCEIDGRKEREGEGRRREGVRRAQRCVERKKRKRIYRSR